MGYGPDQVLDQDKITKIKHLLKVRPKGLTISDIAHQLKMNRNSVAKYLEILLISGHVEMRSFGAAKVFFLSQRVPISAMLSFSSDFILVIDNELQILQINENFLRFLEQDKESLLGKKVNDPPFTFLADLPFSELLKKKQEQRELAVEIQVLKNGSMFYFRTKVVPTVFDDGGQGLTVIMEDISRQKKAQQQLAESEERFKNITELSPFPISIIDPRGYYQYLNRKFIEVFGYTLANIPHGKNWFRLAFPDPAIRKKAMELWQGDLDQSEMGEVRPRTFPVRCKDGSQREIIFRPVTLLNGNQFVTYEDITEKRMAERTQTLVAAIVASSQDAIIGNDLHGTILSWNQGAELMYGYTREEAVGRPISILVPQELLGEYNEILTKIQEGITIHHNMTYRVRKDGSILDVSISISPVRDADGKICAASIIARDNSGGT
jgi:PAS domain S-box-containing protein